MYLFNTKKVRDELAARKWSVKEFAQEAGLSPPTARLAVEGKRSVRLKTLGKICDALNLPPSNLIVEADDTL